VLEPCGMVRNAIDSCTQGWVVAELMCVCLKCAEYARSYDNESLPGRTSEGSDRRQK
jgi:hypothetical protein